jgi:hypothetical protein
MPHLDARSRGLDFSDAEESAGRFRMKAAGFALKRALYIRTGYLLRLAAPQSC